MKNGEQPAFPIDADKNPSSGTNGLTKREYLAAKAMEQLIGSVMCGYNEVYQRQLIDWQEKYGPTTNVKTALCKDAIEIADELLKQLES